MAVWWTNIGSNANQEIHNIVMAPADGIVKGGDAFIVWLARVIHLWKTFYTKSIDDLKFERYLI